MEPNKQLKVYISNRKVNKEKSANPLVHLSYRHLQNIAISLMLPANVKYKILLALIIARTTNREDIVDAIKRELEQEKRNKLSEHKIERKQRGSNTSTHKEAEHVNNEPTQSLIAGQELSTSCENSNLSVQCNDSDLTDFESLSSGFLSFGDASQSKLNANEETWAWDLNSQQSCVNPLEYQSDGLASSEITAQSMMSGQEFQHFHPESNSVTFPISCENSNLSLVSTVSCNNSSVMDSHVTDFESLSFEFIINGLGDDSQPGSSELNANEETWVCGLEQGNQPTLQNL